MIVTTLQYTTNLDSGVQMTPLKNSFLSGDQDAHRFIVSCFRSTSRQPVNLTGAGVTGYFIRADQSTVVIDGKVEDNCAVLTLPAACYAKQGRFSLVIKASLGDVIHTILWVEGAVSLSHTSAIIDPGEVVPTLDVLLAQIEAMEQATANANTATEAANAAATEAVNIATTKGNEAVQAATAKGDEAIQIATEQVAEQNAKINHLTADILTKAPAIECAATAQLVTVTDAAAQPAVQLVTHIEPVQEGEGNPSPENVRAISGWDQVSVTNDTSGQTLTADLPETVYGGTVDWNIGGLTVTRGVYNFTADTQLKEDGDYGDYIRYNIEVYGKPGGVIISSHLASKMLATNGIFLHGITGQINITIDKNIALNVNDALAWLVDNGVMLVYELATPYTIQLAPQQLEMLKGTNNVWSDTGDTDLVYVADTKLYIDGKFAELEAAILSQGANV